MIVIDASSILELLLNTATGHTIAHRISRPELELHAPELLDLEIAQALRRYERSGEIGRARGAIALGNLGQLDIIRHSCRESGTSGVTTACTTRRTLR